MTMQQPPESGVALIKEFEGCHERIGGDTYDIGHGRQVCGDGLYRAYPDPATGGEPWTIGWGTTRDEFNEPIKQGDTATQEEVDRYLLADCDAGMIILADTIPYWDEMSDDQHGALLSFGYNLGWHFYGASGFDTITSELRGHNWDFGVPVAMKLYNKGNGQVMPGLVRRRQAEADLWLQGLNPQPPLPPEPPMATCTLDDFFNTYKYWDGSEHQRNAAKFLYDITAEQHRKIYFDKYRTPVEPSPEPTPPPSDGVVLINCDYMNQRDNPSGRGDRECFSTCCAMAAKHWGVISSENEYHAIRPRYGDSTDANAQLRTLQYLGLNAKFITTASADGLRTELGLGRPTPCGWLHHGHVSAPSGGGHYLTAVGYDPEAEAFIVHDPYGEANLVSGGWVHMNSTSPNGTVYGEYQRYSYANWLPRWSVADPTDGWMMRIWK